MDIAIVIASILLGLFSIAAAESFSVSALLSKPMKRHWKDILQNAADQSVPVGVITGIILTESGGRDDQKFGADGELGIMQMKKSAWIDTVQRSGADFEGIPFESLLDDEIAIKFGSRFIRILYDLTGDWETAIRAYNCCGTNTQRAIRNTELSKQYYENVKSNTETIGLRIP